MLLVRAMIEERLGRHENARASLVQARGPIDAMVSTGKWATSQYPEFWFDWVNAAVLLAEANQMIGAR
jgi:hypothetical protein